MVGVQFTVMRQRASLDVVVLQDLVLCVMEYLDLVVIRGQREHAVFAR